jgi:hypothetical protein
MKKITSVLASLFVALGLAVGLMGASAPAHAWDWSWGGNAISASGTSKTETRNVSGFTAISLGLPAKVIIKQGATEGITIETDEAFLPYIETVVERGALKIRGSKNNTNFRGRFTMNITVNAINLESVAINGSGDISADSLKASNFKASISGSGDVAIKSLSATSVETSIAGSGSIILSGSANDIAASIRGSGDVKAGSLKTKTAKTSIAGSGNVFVWPSDTLTISIAGSGDIRYYGNPAITKSVAGSGSIKKLGDEPKV